MPREHAFLVEGTVIQVLSPKTYRLELSNGHRLFGFIPGKRISGSYQVGDTVRVQLSSYDLSEGRILVETKKDLS
jgi:translation initiation factor IF-1